MYSTLFRNKYKWLLYSLLFLLIGACAKSDDGLIPAEEPFRSGAGVFITNEGLFNQGNASVDYYRWSSESLLPDIYQEENMRPLGDVLQSMYITAERAYLVVNVSQKVEVVNVDDFSSQGVIEGMASPRYFLPLNDREAYVSDLFARAVHRVDLQRLEVIDQIPVPAWTEQMLRVGDDVYVTAPSLFGEAPNTQLYIIDSGGHRLVDSITLAPSPKEIVQDSDGMLWVLCTGSSEDELPGGLFRIDPQQRKLLQSFPFSEVDLSLSPQLAINDSGDMLFFTRGDLYRMSIHSLGLPSEPLLSSSGKQWYSLEIRGDEEIWISDARDFQQAGMVSWYTMDGMPVDSLETGFVPNGFYFY